MNFANIQRIIGASLVSVIAVMLMVVGMVAVDRYANEVPTAHAETCPITGNPLLDAGHNLSPGWNLITGTGETAFTYHRNACCPTHPGDIGSLTSVYRQSNPPGGAFNQYNKEWATATQNMYTGFANGAFLSSSQAYWVYCSTVRVNCTPPPGGVCGAVYQAVLPGTAKA